VHGVAVERGADRLSQRDREIDPDPPRVVDRIAARRRLEQAPQVDDAIRAAARIGGLSGAY